MLRRPILGLLICAAGAFGQSSPSANFYRDTIQPLLQKNCLACHNDKVKQGGLDLSTRDGLLRGSEHGPVVSPGKPDDSQLYKLVAHISEPGMPFKGKKLPDESIAQIAEWIKGGVSYGDAVASAEGANLADAQKHWAFRKPVRPAVPAVRNAKWVRNPVDAFVAAELEKRGLEPVAEANKRTLLRRIYLDLTGLPPSPAAVAEFLADSSPKAYEKVVDKLLATTEYGERWGRHFLDVWRYSDWYGVRASGQVRYSQRHVWRWRDWTIDSFNENKPYDRMIEEMLAADELAPSDPKLLPATGYLARNWYMFNRNVWLQDTVDFTAMGFLGLTLKCARCHTHKYDPIPHSDYYKFRAFFEPEDVRIDRVSGQADTVKDGLARVYDADATRVTYRFIRGNENNPDTSLALQPAVPRLFGDVDLRIKPVPLPVDAYFPDGRPFVPDDLRAQAQGEIEKAEAELKKAREKPDPVPVMIAAAEKRVAAAKAAVPALEARIRADLASMATPVPANAEQLAGEARKLERQANSILAEANLLVAHYEFDQAKADPAKTDEKKLASATRKLEAALNLLKEPAEGYTPIGVKYPTSSSGRRLALARWIASKDNPLTARVAINHIWMRHFGKPLVPTVFNFGKSGKPPTHPELLDWLAVEFMDRNWDMKAIHRLLVTSSAYRMQSGYAPDAPQLKTDPDNTHLWHANLRRMEAETVRDSILSIAGKLDLTMHGPEIEPGKGEEVYRRSVYFRHAPDVQMDMLKVFDIASANECFQRSESIVPQQALALANSELSLAMARVIASQLGTAGDGQEFVAAAFEHVLGRAPSDEEARASADYLRSQAELYRDSSGLSRFVTGPQAKVKPATEPAQRARESLVHVLLNHNDFVTIR